MLYVRHNYTQLTVTLGLKAFSDLNWKSHLVHACDQSGEDSIRALIFISFYLSLSDTHARSRAHHTVIYLRYLSIRF